MKSIALCATILSSPAFSGEPKFADRSRELPAQHQYEGGWEHFVGGGVAVFDCNDDGRPDFFTAGGEAQSLLFVNTTSDPGDPLSFVLSGDIEAGSAVTGAYPLDIDGDDHLDLFVLRVGANGVLRGVGQCEFEDATDVWKIDPGGAWSTAFSATWEPGNAWPTLAVGNYVDRDDPEGPFGACDDNHLLRPDGESYQLPIHLKPGYCALSMLISDWTRSGRADLRISNDRHYYVRDGYEQMWRLDTLTSLGDEEGWDRLSIWGMGIASRDLTADGRPEVFLTSMGDQIMQLSDGTTGFRKAPYDIGTYAQRPHVGEDGRPSTGWHAEFGDIDNDGLADLFIAKGNVDQMPGNASNDPNNLLMQRDDGTFAERSVDAGVATTARSRGAALADFDGDGLLDLVVVNRSAPLELWQNVTADAGNWIGVDPRQGTGNRRAVGAWIEVRTEDGIQAQEVTVGGGHAGGRTGPIHFGLGKNDSVLFRVIWPDGKADDWQFANAGQVIKIDRK